jgi:hypothetical protein
VIIVQSRDIFAPLMAINIASTQGRGEEDYRTYGKNGKNGMSLGLVPFVPSFPSFFAPS